jgi:hypothetical protein
MFGISSTILAPLLTPMDMLSTNLSSLLGFPPDQMILILLLILHIPIAAGLRWIKSSKTRNIYVLLFGFWTQFVLYKDRKSSPLYSRIQIHLQIVI